MKKSIKILLVGTGAVGSYYGGRLAQAGAEVSVVCRSDFQIVKEQGIYLNSVAGNFHFKPKEVLKRVSDYQDQPDYILVATKVLPEIKVVDLIKEKVCKKTSIVLLQNGINIEADIEIAFPNNQIISGLAFICATRAKFGQVDHQDYGRITVGKYPLGISNEVNILADYFRKASVDCNLDEDIIKARWIKLVWNAPFNPISVLGGGVDTKAILASEATFNVVKKVMKEVYILAEKDGHSFSYDIIAKNISDTLKMTPYKTSMLIDYESRRPMEVEAILGNALKLGKKYAVSIPYLESLYGLLKLIDKANLEGAGR